MFDPKGVTCAADLPAPLPVVLEEAGTLNLQARQPLFYAFNWLRETGLGSIEGDLGLKVDAGGEVSARLSASGSQRREISLDERGWLRLRVSKRRTREFGFAAQVGVSAQLTTPLPNEPDELVAAILGVHKDQGLAARLDQIRELWKALLNGPAAEGLTAFQRLDDWPRQQIETLFGSIREATDVTRLLNGLRALMGLRDSVYARAVEALQKKREAELSYRYSSAEEDTALVDCSFAFTAEGLAAYRRALTGDYSWILTADPGQTAVREGLLTAGLRNQATVELHLPFFNRKEWSSRLEALAKMEVASDGDGRLLVYHVEASDRVEKRNAYQSVLALAGGMSVGRRHSSSSFTLTYSDQRRLPAARVAGALAPALAAYSFPDGSAAWLREVCDKRAGDVDVSLELSIPGSLVSAWLEAPGEREAEFFPAYARMSVAVQRAVRLWLPYIYFSDIGRYENLGAAFPLVVYQVSRPFNGRPKAEFTYDVLNDARMVGFRRMAAAALPVEMERIQSLLVQAGRTSTAAYYRPERAPNIVASVKADRSRRLRSLLVADALLVDALVNLGCRGRRLRKQAASDPAAAVKSLSRFAADLASTFHGKLRRLYGGQEFLALGGLLLVEATAALSQAAASPVQAVLRISQEPTGSGPALRETLVNGAYLPAPSA